MVKLFSIFSRGTIIFVQASLIFYFFYYSVEPQIKKQCLIFISSFSVNLYLLLLLSVSSYFSDHCGFFFLEREGTNNFVHVCIYIYIYIYIYIIQISLSLSHIESAACR